MAVRQLSVSQLIAEDLKVQPDQRDHQAERAVPLHVLGGLRRGGLLDEVEVEQQVERREADHEQAEADAELGLR